MTLGDHAAHPGVDFERPYSAIATVLNTGEVGGSNRFVHIFDFILV